ncbi:hypothetical protein ABXT68_00790 [Candidatus Pelagibacter sp. Uisw_116]|uniref:hypothetical protein n=1 Tax=Candidatus Pelagibacter sp. Uisw_116 TaxID=3230986 RepID=UPI0039EA27BE
MNYIKKILSPSYLAISLFLLLYTFYKSEIIWNGEKRDYYLIYYIISIILIIFSTFTFYLNQKIKDYLIISLVSVVGCLYLAEGYLSSKEPLQKEQFSEKETGKKYDKRTKLEIYNDLKKINNKIAMVIYPRSHLKDKNKILPLSGISNSKTLFCNENGYYAIYESDRYGFNNPDKEWDQNEIEYVLVGDSYTHGACVNRPNDIASVLRTLSNKSALNLGYYYNSPLIEYATLREYLTSNVKKVVWIYFGNDIVDLNDELNNKILKNYLNSNDFTQNLKSKQNEIDDLVIAKVITKIEKGEALNTIRGRENKFIFSLIKFVKIYNLRHLLFSSSRSEKKLLQEFKKILKLNKDLTAKNNSQLFFVYLPGYPHHTNNNNYNSYLSVKKIVNELDIPFIDLHTGAFGKNEEGYRRAAETIYKFTKDWKSN